MNKRDFIKCSSSALLYSLGGMTLPRVSRAAIAQDSDVEFVFQFHVRGGWDVTLSTDPFKKELFPEKEFFLEYNSNDIFKKGSLSLGPAAQSLKSFSTDMCVVNGIVQRTDSGHDSLMRYITTGHGEGLAPAVALQNSISHSSLLGLLQQGTAYTAGSTAPTFNSYSGLSALQDKNNLLSLSAKFDAGSDREKILQKFISIQAEIPKALDEVKSLKQQFNDKDFDFYSQILPIFKRQWANSCYIELSDQNVNLDTHTDHPKNHLRDLKLMFERIEKMISASKTVSYKGGTIYDKSLFIVTSEMSRTPALNAANGKDHNPYCNSYIFIGPSVKGSQSLGGSHLIPSTKSTSGMPVHIGLPYDRKAQKLIVSKDAITPTTAIIFPENVVKALYLKLGLKDQAQQRFSQAWDIKGIFKS